MWWSIDCIVLYSISIVIDKQAVGNGEVCLSFSVWLRAGWRLSGLRWGCGGAAVGLQWGWLFWLAVYVSGPCLLRPICTKSAGGFEKKEVVQGCIIVVAFITPAQFRPVREAGQRRGRAWKHGVEERGSTAWRWIAAAWKRCRRYCAQPIQQRTDQTEFRPRRRQPVNLPREANRQRCSPQDFFFRPRSRLHAAMTQQIRSAKFKRQTMK